MKRVLLVLFAGLSLAAQETTLPEGHYCMNHAPRPNEPRAHECHCDYICSQDEDGVWEYHEDQQCKLYCRRAKNACTCHPEEPCPRPS
jgi:hypothetical protein